jgi:hypothetical protein
MLSAIQAKVAEPVQQPKKFGPVAKEARRKEKEERDRQKALQRQKEEEQRRQAAREAAYDPGLLSCPRMSSETT